jgi:hypothetical protein
MFKHNGEFLEEVQLPLKLLDKAQLSRRYLVIGGLVLLELGERVRGSCPISNEADRLSFYLISLCSRSLSYSVITALFGFIV